MVIHEQMQDVTHVRSACEKVKAAAAASAEAIAENARASVPEHTYDERPGAKSKVRSANDELAEHVPTILAMMTELAELRAERAARSAVIAAAEAWRDGLASKSWLEGHVDTFRHAVYGWDPPVLTSAPALSGPPPVSFPEEPGVVAVANLRRYLADWRKAREDVVAVPHATAMEELFEAERTLDDAVSWFLDHDEVLRSERARAESLRVGLERVIKGGAEGLERALAEAQSALDWDEEPLPPPSPVDTRPWCWRKPSSETCQGPFPTREEAIHDARHGWACTEQIEVGRCTPPVLGLDIATLMEQAGEYLCDDGWDVTVLSREGAEDALDEWCERYLYAKGEPWAIEDAETLPALESEDDDG